MTVEIKNLHGQTLWQSEELDTLYKANLRGANLFRANLHNANLSKANLSKADLYEANLHGVDLFAANLSGANLHGANLSKADLSKANLSKANLSGANLHGADLFGCTGIVVFGPIGNSKRLGYIVTSETSVNVKLGCFWGPLDAAITAIQGKYGKNSSYQACVEAMANLLLNK